MSGNSAATHTAIVLFRELQMGSTSSLLDAGALENGTLEGRPLRSTD